VKITADSFHIRAARIASAASTCQHNRIGCGNAAEAHRKSIAIIFTRLAQWSPLVINKIVALLVGAILAVMEADALRMRLHIASRGSAVSVAVPPLQSNRGAMRSMPHFARHSGAWSMVQRKEIRDD